MTSVLIALFIASQDPSPKNCAKLSDELLHVAQKESEEVNQRAHLERDVMAIRLFVSTTCKDGHKHK